MGHPGSLHTWGPYCPQYSPCDFSRNPPDQQTPTGTLFIFHRNPARPLEVTDKSKVLVLCQKKKSTFLYYFMQVPWKKNECFSKAGEIAAGHISVSLALGQVLSLARDREIGMNHHFWGSGISLCSFWVLQHTLQPDHSIVFCSVSIFIVEKNWEMALTP